MLKIFDQLVNCIHILHIQVSGILSSSHQPMNIETNFHMNHTVSLLHHSFQASCSSRSYSLGNIFWKGLGKESESCFGNDTSFWFVKHLMRWLLNCDWSKRAVSWLLPLCGSTAVTIENIPQSLFLCCWTECLHFQNVRIRRISICNLKNSRLVQRWTAANCLLLEQFQSLDYMTKSNG